MLALGARACLVGKAFLYGLAAFGTRGVLFATRSCAPTETTMALTGARSVADIDRSRLVMRGTTA